MDINWGTYRDRLLFRGNGNIVATPETPYIAWTLLRAGASLMVP